MFKLKKGLVINNLNNDQEIELIKKYKAKTVRISRHYNDLNNQPKLLKELTNVKQNGLEWVLLTGHSVDEMYLSNRSELRFRDLLIFLDKYELPYPRLIILGNESNELQNFWHKQACKMNKRYPKIQFVPQAPTSVAENAGYKTMVDYLSQTDIKFHKDIVMHFYLRPCWKIDSSFTNLQRVNKLISVMNLIKKNKISNVHIMESHDGMPEQEGGDYVISSYFGNRLLFILGILFNLSSIYHYSSSGLNNKDTTILKPFKDKKDYLGLTYTLLGGIVLFPYTLYTIGRFLKYKIYEK